MKCVYLINKENTDVYKIGITKNKSKRIKALQTGSDEKLILLKFFQSELANEIEGALHKQFHHTKYSDYENPLMGEWFVLNSSDVLSFQETCKKIEERLIFIKDNSTIFDKK